MNDTLTLTPQTEEMAAHAELIRRFSSDDVLTELVRQAVREAVLEHKRNGNPVGGSVNGKVAIFQPEDIDVAEE